MAPAPLLYARRQMPSPICEVTQEVHAVGWKLDGKLFEVLVRALAERLDGGERIADALPGRRWFPDTFSTFEGWLVVTPTRMLAIAMDPGGWFSGPSVRAVSQLLFSDILETGLKFTSGGGRWAGKPGHDITVKTLAVTEHLNVPLDWAAEERVHKFVDGLRARCLGVESLPGLASNRSFAEELKLLSDLKAGGLLNDEEVAQAIRKLMAQ